MDTYIDIRLLPDPEFPATTLMNALFGKLHRGLVAHGEGRIGVSFPDVKDNSRSLGNRLRLHGTALDLHGLTQVDWLSGMRDHVTVHAAAQIPAGAGHRIVRRVQAKNSPARERRRLIARKGIGQKEAEIAIPDQCAEHLDLPYAVLNSHSTGQQFRIFIEQRPVQDKPSAGAFSAYGLSSTATIPWF